MDFPATAIATVAAAFVAAFVAFITSVLSKELKTSEFRYAWLNAVLDDIAKFTGGAQSITVAAWSRLQTTGRADAEAFLASAEPQIRETFAAYYRARIRLYPDDHKEVIKALDSLQAILAKGDIIDPVNIATPIQEIVRVSHEALKAQWQRVKGGESTFRWTKSIALGVIVAAVLSAIGFMVFKAIN